MGISITIQLVIELGHIAQWLEHLKYNQEITDSIPGVVPFLVLTGHAAMLSQWIDDLTVPHQQDNAGSAMLLVTLCYAAEPQDSVLTTTVSILLPHLNLPLRYPIQWMDVNCLVMNKYTITLILTRAN